MTKINLPSSIIVEPQDNRGKKRTLDVLWIQPGKKQIHGKTQDALTLGKGHHKFDQGYFRDEISRDVAMNFVIAQSLQKLYKAPLPYKEYFKKYPITPNSKEYFFNLPGLEIIVECLGTLPGRPSVQLTNSPFNQAYELTTNRKEIITDELISIILSGSIPREKLKHIIILFSNQFPAIDYLSLHNLEIPKSVLWTNLFGEQFVIY